MASAYKHFPWSIPDIEKLQRRGAEPAHEICARFITGIPSRVEYLESLTDLSWVYSGLPIDRLREPLATFGRWIESHDLWEYHEKAGPLARVKILDARHTKYLKQLEAQWQQEPAWELTKVGESIMLDLGMLLGEFVRVRFPWTAWIRDDRRSSFFFNLPCVGWFDGELNKTIAITQYPGTLLHMSREDKKRIGAVINDSLANISAKAVTPGTRTKWTR